MTLQREIMEMKLEDNLHTIIRETYQKNMEDCSSEELYYALLLLTKAMIGATERIMGDKKIYYISAEFLIGKLLSSNLINLGIYNRIDALFQQQNIKLADVLEVEPEPSLGNGGLGRLAACFLDSIATLGLPGDGVGLNYHFGLFRQVFEDNKQVAYKNDWIDHKNSWLRKTNTTFDVHMGGKILKSRLFEMDVVGYENGINRLRLFDLETVDEGIVKEGIDFDKTDIEHNLTLFLYPDDSDEAGNLLRIYQQYFMVCNAAQLILKELRENKRDLRKMYNYAVIQINDTHPTMIILELIRILVQDKAFTFEEAVEVVSKTCAYTNHTILAEALEKWPLEYFEKAVPQLVPIILELDKLVKEQNKNSKLWIIDKNQRVHMAHIDIHFGFSVNGVAAIHTDILKKSELKPFYKLYPEKFNNKTNGITFRRWLFSCNPQLEQCITRAIGDAYKKDATKLEDLLQFKDDEVVLDEIKAIKSQKKQELAQYIMEHEQIEIDVNSIFDIQIKRLHEYKRQQMNALYLIHKYLEIKEGILPKQKVTYIFGAKAAPAYVIAQDIIHLILCLQEFINADEEVSKYMKVVMVENYNVSYAEKLIPACDVSEQISLSSKEASGTGNMKFMLNGAITLGTSDGANVEIHELVKDDNIFIFGASSKEVMQHYKKEDYCSKAIYQKDKVIKKAVDVIVSKKLLEIGDKVSLKRLHKELVNKDWFMTLLDFRAYIEAKDRCFDEYSNQEKWKKMMLVNIAKAGFFSSDRTIMEYNRDIWKL